MVTIKIPGMKDVKLSSIEFNLLAQSLIKMVDWEIGGMFGDGSNKIVDTVGFARAKRIIQKLGYK